MNLIIKILFNHYKQLLSSVSLVMLFRAFGAAVGFISGILITRYLGIKESGIYFYAIDLITTIAVISGLGLNNALLRDVASAETQSDITSVTQKFWTIVSVIFLISLISIFTVITGRNEISQFVSKVQLSTPLLIMSLLIFMIPLNSYLVTFLQGQKRLIKSSLLQFILPYTFLSLFILLLKPNNSIDVAFIHLMVIILTVLIGLLFTKKQLFIPKASHRRKIQGWGSFVTMHMFSSFSIMFISLINGYFLIPEEFAVLTAANRYTLLISFCLIAFNFVAAPKYAKLYKEGKTNELCTFVQSVTRFLIIITIPCSLIVLIFQDQFMSLYGQEFSDYGYILAILIGGQVINVVTGSVAYLLTLSGHEKDLKNIIVVLTPISVILSFILADRFGLSGIAVAMAISAININICAYIMVVKRLGFHTISFNFNSVKP